MARANHVFLKNEINIFFASGLDRANQLEPTGKIRFFAHTACEKVLGRGSGLEKQN
jgi:hypothetical protein